MKAGTAFEVQLPCRISADTSLVLIPLCLIFSGQDSDKGAVGNIQFD